MLYSFLEKKNIKKKKDFFLESFRKIFLLFFEKEKFFSLEKEKRKHIIINYIIYNIYI